MDAGKRFVELNRVTHPTDLQPEGEAAFAHALRLACAARSSLHIAHVARSAEEVSWSDFPGVRATLARWKLLPPDATEDDLIERVGVRVAKLTIQSANVPGALLEEIERHPADVIVVATHQRRGLDRWLHAKISQVARASGELTLFVPPGVAGFVDGATGAVSLGRILIPVAIEPPPTAALQAVAGLGRLLGCDRLDVRLLHVGAQSESGISPAFEPPPPITGWTWASERRTGDVVDTILQSATELEADLLVLATAGRTGFLDALRGSTTERVVAGARCPVLAVPAH